jgi:sigma-B regulation protein RsbU (phosphoserine phosphatase)
MRVLVVEDEEISAIVLSENLRGLGFEVTLAHDGEEGWQRFNENEFSILIVDWMMPKLDGLELCRRVRASGGDSYTYVILLTGRSEREDRIEALRGGADDFLTKPVDPAELQARLNVATRIMSSEAALRKANAVLQEAQQREAELGSEIQRTLLLGAAPASVPNLSISSLSLASQHVAGDFVDFYLHADGITDILAGDVMGKGIPASMVAAGVKSAIEKSLVRLLGQGFLPTPCEVLQRVARIAVRELIELNTFVTLCYVRYDATANELCYVNCGHPQVLHWRASDSTSHFLPTSTVPMGFVENDTFPETKISVGAGDLFLIYSDGITDLRLPSGGTLGQDGFLAWIDELAHLPLDEIMSSLQSLRDSGRADDDVTCIAIRVVEEHSDSHRIVWSEPGTLAHLREAVRASAHKQGKLSEDQISDLILGIQEAGSNAIRHARPHQQAIPIAFAVIETERGLRVELRYPGLQFDPRVPADSGFNLEREGGFGLAIIVRCADKIEYAFENGWNTLVLEKWSEL